MLRVLTDNHYTTVSLDDFALVAHWLYRCSNLHFYILQLFLTPCDSSASQIIRRQFDLNSVTRQNTNVVHSDFAGDMSEYFEIVIQPHLDHCVRLRIDTGSHCLYIVAFCHYVPPIAELRSQVLRL